MGFYVPTTAYLDFISDSSEIEYTIREEKIFNVTKKGIFPTSATDCSQFYGILGLVRVPRLIIEVPVVVPDAQPKATLSASFETEYFRIYSFDAKLTNVTDWQWLITHDGGDTWRALSQKSGAIPFYYLHTNRAGAGIKLRVWNGVWWAESNIIWGDGRSTESTLTNVMKISVSGVDVEENVNCIVTKIALTPTVNIGLDNIYEEIGKSERDVLITPTISIKLMNNTETVDKEEIEVKVTWRH